jgi:membrane associated rhomboid family serine protease
MHDEEDHIRSATSAREAQEWALVLASAGIPHRVEHRPGQWRLVVDARDAERAAATLDSYDQEHRPPEVPPAEYGGTSAGFLVAPLLLAFYVVTGPAELGGRWSRVGSASAERILDGELWRTVTALTLHANAAHLLGNAVACAVFVTAVARELGPGVAVWLVLLAGAAGNALNALLHGAHHSSVGASTAIFGAIGILGGLQSMRRRGRRRAGLAAAGTLALLAMLGTGEHTDVLAHLFGLFAGLVLGAAAALWLRRPPGRLVQWTLAASALAAVVGCWLVALGAL